LNPHHDKKKAKNIKTETMMKMIPKDKLQHLSLKNPQLNPFFVLGLALLDVSFFLNVFFL
jgi:hypothetical protein